MDTLQVRNDFSFREDLIILIFVTCKTVSIYLNINTFFECLYKM